MSVSLCPKCPDGFIATKWVPGTRTKWWGRKLPGHFEVQCDSCEYTDRGSASFDAVARDIQSWAKRNLTDSAKTKAWYEQQSKLLAELPVDDAWVGRYLVLGLAIGRKADVAAAIRDVWTELSQC